MPVLDTNLLIRYDEGDPQVENALRRIEHLPRIVPFQAALEFGHGFDDGHVDADLLPGALEAPDMAVLYEAVRLGQRERAQGHRIRTGDLWIAAHALARDDYVVSTNKRRFRHLGVACWHWQDEADPPA